MHLFLLAQSLQVRPLFAYATSARKQIFSKKTSHTHQADNGILSTAVAMSSRLMIFTATSIFRIMILILCKIFLEECVIVIPP